jgi:hypothetical protein
MIIYAKRPVSSATSPRQASDSGDNTSGPEWTRGAIVLRQGSGDVMGTDRLSTRAGCCILLVAMAIQGLTPDQLNLASSWLLRLVLAEMVDSPSADGDRAPSQTPSPLGQEDGAPDEIVSTVVHNATPRVRIDSDRWLPFDALPVDIRERPTRSALHSLHPPGVVVQGSDGLILSLCRLIC